MEDGEQSLARITTLALRKLEEILELPLIQGAPDFKLILSAQKDAASNVVSLALRADEHRFRVKNNDKLMTLLDQVRTAATTFNVIPEAALMLCGPDSEPASLGPSYQ